MVDKTQVGPTGGSNLLTSLVLVLPLFVLYEIGVVTADRMNGADFLTGSLIHLVGTKAFLGIQVGILVLVLLIAAYLKQKQEFRIRQLLPVILESGFYAITMGTLIIFLMVDVLHIDPRLAAGGPMAGSSVFQKIVMSAGAGFHEELVFRLGLMGGMLWFLKKTGVVQNRVIALLLVLLISSILFSAAHHIGPLGDPLKVGVFVFRVMAGLFFGLLYHFRGFAIAVYTHTLYDIYVLVLG